MQNFGKIKNVFNNLIIEGIVKKDNDSRILFKKYIKTIRESEILKTQFLVYSNIENRVDSDSFSANIFVSENVKLLDKFKKEDILKENQKLADILGKINMGDDYELSKLHESLSKLIITKRTTKNIDRITGEIKNVTNYIVSNKVKEITEGHDLPTSFLTNIMVKKYNERYNELEESDKKVLRVLMGPSFDDKKNLYSDIVNECIGLVDELLVESDSESKEKLLKVKGKLLENSQDLNETDFIAKISKLIELKDNLRVN